MVRIKLVFGDHMARLFGSYPGFEGYSEAAMRQMRKSQKIEAMVDWFHGHFEDPAERLPYISAEGGYQWIYGGPHDADEEIQGEFSDIIDDDTMMKAVEKVQEEGLFDWAPKPSPGDYDDDRPYDDDLDAGLVVDGDGDWPPLVPIYGIPEPEARAEAMRRLGQLEELIRPLVTKDNERPTMMGHNNPPTEFLIAQAVPLADWQQVQVAIEEIRDQANAAVPIQQQVERPLRLIVSVAESLGGWLRERINAAIDAGTAVAVGYGIARPDVVLEALQSAATAVQNWLGSLPLSF